MILKCSCPEKIASTTFTYAIYSQFHANTFDKKNLNDADIHDLGIKKSHKQDLTRVDKTRTKRL